MFVVADDDGVPHAFLNTCRHRGARLVDAPEGQIRRLQCPYHAWTYGFDGSLRNAPFTDGARGLRPRLLRAARRCALAVVEGLVLVDLSGHAPPAEEHVGDLAPLLARYRLGELRRARRLVYEVDANWKAIAENYSECLHCPGVHPELNRLCHYLSGEHDRGRRRVVRRLDGARRGRRDDGASTAATQRPPIAGLTEQDLRTSSTSCCSPTRWSRCTRTT